MSLRNKKKKDKRWNNRYVLYIQNNNFPLLINYTYVQVTFINYQETIQRVLHFLAHFWKPFPKLVPSHAISLWLIISFGYICSFKSCVGTSVVVQWLRLHPSNAGGEGLIPCWGTKIPQATRLGQKIKNKKSVSSLRPLDWLLRLPYLTSKNTAHANKSELRVKNNTLVKMCSKYYMKHTSTKKIICWNSNLTGYSVYYLNNSTNFLLQKHFIQRKYGALGPITHPQSIYHLLPGVSPFRSFSVGLSSVQFSSVTQSCPTLCDPMNHSTPGLPVHHQLLEFTQTHVHQVSDAIQPSHHDGLWYLNQLSCWK